MFRRFTFTLGWLLALTIVSLAQTDAKSSIAGRITLQGQPVPEVLVTITKDSFNYENPLAQARTDAEGRYKFTNLTAQSYRITPLTGPYVASGNRDFYGTFLKVTLQAGEEATGLDFTLTRGGVITGRVTDAEGKPMIRQSLTISRVGPKGDQQVIQPNLSTDDRGIYRMYGLTAGQYVVSAGRNPQQQVYGLGNRIFYAQTFYPGTNQRAEAKIIEVSEGSEATGVDIQLGAPQTAFSATGRVVNAETGAPVAGVIIGYGKLTNGQLNGFGFDGVRTATDGRFTLNGLSAGEYAAFSADFGNQKKETYTDSVQFSITDDDVKDLEIKQHQGLRLSGQVVVEGATNTAQALARLPEIMAFYPRNPNNITSFAGDNATQVAPDGTFTITGLRPGKLQLAFKDINNAPFSLIRMTLNGADIARDGIEVVAGQNVENVLLVAEEGTSKLTGQANFINGTLAAQDQVHLSVSRRNQAGFSRRTQLDARRSFVLNNLGRGEYALRISVFGPSGPRYTTVAPHTVRVDGPENNITLTIDLAAVPPPAPEKKP